MIHFLGALGFSAGALLLFLLVWNVRVQSLEFWPTQAGASRWQSITFWGLFRALNVSALILAALDWRTLGPDDAYRLVAAAAALGGGAAYVVACVSLGRTNLYGAAAGLNVSGLYGWSRNPQYALAIPTYAALAVAAQSLPMAILAAMLMLVFLLMALGEEPWLQRAYGDAYTLYKAQVPRFYNAQRLLAVLSPEGKRGTSP